MIKFEDMLDDVLPDVPGCPNDLAIIALRNAAIELHTKSLLYIQDCDQQQTVIGQAEYDVDMFSGYKVVDIVSAKFNEVSLVKVSIRMLERTRMRWENDEGSPTHFYTNDFSTIRLYRIPDVVGDLNIKVALTLAKNAAGIENFIYDLYSEQLAAGAKARLMLIPSKPFTDVNASREYRAQFAAAITDAKWRAHKSLTGSQLQALPQFIIG